MPDFRVGSRVRRIFFSSIIHRCVILVVAQAILFGGRAGVLGAQDAPSSPRIRVDAAEITLSGRVQMQLNTSSVDGQGPTEMLLRRVRFGANVRINETVSGRVQPELSGSTLSLADAYVQLTFSPGLNVLMGRAHRPFTAMEQLTSTQILPIERGVRIRGLTEVELSSLLTSLRYSDRDVGVQVRGSPAGAPGRFSYALAALAGPLQGATGDDGTVQLVARGTVVPVDRTRVGVAWSRRDFRQPPAVGDEMRGGNAFALDVEYGGPTPAPGLHVIAEAVRGDFDPFTSRRFTGGQVWAGYVHAVEGRVTAVEPLLRLSHADIDETTLLASPGGTLVTPGLNIYFGGLNRLMLNLDLWSSASASNENSFRAQMQMAF